tara:strand:- start:101 stop:907 length:807 start_codon:yes stop_codon:yes gene_type:complete
VSKTFKLSPSDFAFLWNECKRCFYLKVAKNIRRPSTPMPTIFVKIDSIMKDYFEHKCTTSFHKDLPKGKVEFGDRWIQSKVFNHEKTGNKFFIKGKTDTVVKFDNGSYGIIDFKTSKIKPENVEKYSRQLHAYSLALEKPEVGKPFLKPVRTLGLLVVEPNSMSDDTNGCLFKNSMSWQPITKDYYKFKSFINDMMSLLSLHEAPDASEKCQWCKFSKHGVTNYAEENYEDFYPNKDDLMFMQNVTQEEIDAAGDAYIQNQVDIMRGK